MNYFLVKQFPVLTSEQIPTEIWAEELWEEMSNEQRAELP